MLSSYLSGACTGLVWCFAENLVNTGFLACPFLNNHASAAFSDVLCLSLKNCFFVFSVLVVFKNDTLTVLALCWVGACIGQALYLSGACMVLVWCLVLNSPITRLCQGLLLRWSRRCRFIHQVKNALHQGVDRVLVGSLWKYQKVPDQVFYPGVCCRVR